MDSVLGVNENTIPKHAWDVFEHRNGAPEETGRILDGGHIAFHYTSSEFEDGPQRLRIIPNQERSDITRRLVGLHQALVFIAGEIIKESMRKVADCPINFEGIDMVNGFSAGMTEDLIKAYKAQMKAGAGTGRKKKRRRVDQNDEQEEEDEGYNDDVKKFVADMVNATAWKRVKIKNFFIGEIEANCTVSDVRGIEAAGERYLRSETWMSNLCYPDDITPPNPTIVNWDFVLSRIILDNCKRLEEEKQPSKFKAPVVGDKEFDDLKHVYSGYQFVEEYILPMIAHEDMAFTNVILDNEFVAMFRKDNGMLDPMIGPWSYKIRKDYPQLCLDQVFSFMNILRWKDPADNSLPPMYRQQLTDDSLYLQPYLQTLSMDIDITERGQVDHYRYTHEPVNAYTEGFSFKELYEQCPKLKRSIFVIDQKNTQGPTWRVERPSFSWWWSVPLPEDQATEVAGCGVYMPSICGIGTHLLKADHHSKVPLHRDMLPAIVPVDNEDPNVIDLIQTSPVEQFATRGARSVRLFKQAVKSLRAGVLPLEDFVSLHRLQLQQAKVLMDLIPNMTQACESTRAMMQKLKEDGFLFRREGESKFVYDLLAPDFEGGCNYTQYTSVLLEFLGVSTLHGTFHLLQITNISGCWPKSDLRFNTVLYGVPESGKSFNGELLIALSIPGTIISHQVDTDCANTSETEKPVYHGTIYHHEIPNGFLVDRKEKGGAGTKAENVLKVQMTEHAVITRTACVDNGHRFLRKVKRPHHATMIVMCNAKSRDEFSDAIINRVTAVKVPTSDRTGHSVADYSAWNESHDPGSASDDVTLRARHIVQMVQAFTAEIGTLIYSGVLPSPNTTAFALMHKHVSVFLAKKGQSITGRNNIKAKEMAMALMFQRICFDECLQPFAPCSGQFDLRDQFDRHNKIAAKLVVSEAEAMKAMVFTVAAFSETDVRRLGVSILHMMADCKQKDSYSKYFVTRSHRVAAFKKPKGQYADPEEEEEGVGQLDLSMARFEVGKTTESLTNWCGDLCKIMQQIYGCTISKTQVRETLNLIADSQGPWKFTKHKPQDMNIPFDSGCGMDTVGEWTVKSMQDDAMNRGMPPGPAKSAIDLAGERWRDDPSYEPGNPNSVYFPYEMQGTKEIITTTNCDLSHYMGTGYITFSTAFLVELSGKEIGNTAELMEAMCTTNTTPRCIVSVVVTDTVTYGTTLPYVHPTAMLRTHPTRESVVPNPKHADKGLWEKVMGQDTTQPEGRNNSELIIPSYVPLDAFTSYTRVRDLAEQDPMMTPDVFTMLPWSCISSIICPGILELLERTDPEFHAMYKESGPERDKIIMHRVRKYFKHNMDLVCHCITDEDGVHHPIDTSHRARKKATLQIKCIAHRVCCLSKSKGMGRMREACVNMPDEQEILTNIKHLKYALQNPGTDYDYSNPDDSAFQNLACLPKETLNSQMIRQQAKLQEIRTLRKQCQQHSASDSRFSSYLDQYRYKIEMKEIIHHHKYEPFLQWIRSKAKYLQEKQAIREAKWKDQSDL